VHQGGGIIHMPGRLGPGPQSNTVRTEDPPPRILTGRIAWPSIRHTHPQRAQPIFPQVLDARIDALNYEVGRTGPDDLKPLADYEWSKDFVAGIIDVKSTVTETADEVADRIRAVLEFVPPERVGLSTDCGLINLPRAIAAGKLRALADGAAIVRAELTKSNG
jgi:methionine synthase II (cobalamin-independent)